jgi:hypothetical protein
VTASACWRFGACHLLAQTPLHRGASQGLWAFEDLEGPSPPASGRRVSAWAPRGALEGLLHRDRDHRVRLRFYRFDARYDHRLGTSAPLGGHLGVRSGARRLAAQHRTSCSAAGSSSPSPSAPRRSTPGRTRSSTATPIRNGAVPTARPRPSTPCSARTDAALGAWADVAWKIIAWADPGLRFDVFGPAARPPSRPTGVSRCAPT